MKKALTILSVAVLAIVLLFVWLNSEKIFLKDTSPDSISVIEVRNGQTGGFFEIKNKNDISYITESIKSHSFKKSGVSLFRLGTGYTLSFYDENQKKTNEFIINGDNQIRKDPFFYKTDDNFRDIIDYLSLLEAYR